MQISQGSLEHIVRNNSDTELAFEFVSRRCHLMDFS